MKNFSEIKESVKNVSSGILNASPTQLEEPIIIGENLPPEITRKTSSLKLIGIVIIVIALISIPVLRSISVMPFLSLIGLSLFLFGYIREKSVKKHGYYKLRLRTIEYRGITAIHKQPRGVTLVRESSDENGLDQLFHMSVAGKNDAPPLNWYIDVFIPADAYINNINNINYISQTLGYKLINERDIITNDI